MTESTPKGPNGQTGVSALWLPHGLSASGARDQHASGGSKFAVGDASPEMTHALGAAQIAERFTPASARRAC